MKNTYLGSLEQTIDDLVNALSAFTEEQVNLVPFEGSWTAGQATEHILKSIQGIPQLLVSDAIVTERDPHKYEAQIKDIFLDFTTKMKSPDFILPGDGPFDKKNLVNRIKETIVAIKNESREADFSKTITRFSFPDIGPLTGYELLCFAYCHTARHTLQVKKIYNAIAATEKNS